MEKTIDNQRSEDNIAPTLYSAQHHWISYLFPIMMVLLGIFGIVLTFFGVGVLRILGFLLLYILFRGVKSSLKIFKTKIVLTEEYLTITQGVLGSRTSDIALKKLEGVEVRQNLLGKILNYGILHVSTGGIYHRYVISNPLEFRNKIINLNKNYG